LLPFVSTVTLLIYLLFQALFSSEPVVKETIKKDKNVDGNGDEKSKHVNKTYKKDVDKVVDSYDVSEVADQCSAKPTKTIAYCRCWKSKNFPYCDGTHGKHNKETGDNVGPICITNK